MQVADMVLRYRLLWLLITIYSCYYTSHSVESSHKKEVTSYDLIKYTMQYKLCSVHVQYVQNNTFRSGIGLKSFESGINF